MPFPITILSQYNYHLPESKIAFSPVSKRADSKLLQYNKGDIRVKKFNSILESLKPEDTLYFNNAKVIPARIHVTKETGALIEIFLLEPSNKDYGSLYHRGSSRWKCLVGNKKRWKEGPLTLKLSNYDIEINWVDREKGEIEFIWNEDIVFSNVLDEAGKIPLPPYVKREVEREDSITYQTVYAKEEGAVAAPTAGLHFTEDILAALSKKKIEQQEITLYVGAGTFKPVTNENVAEHDMHTEKFCIKSNVIKSILENKGRRCSVGTTSLRVLESIYWMGVKLHTEMDNPFYLNKEEVYELPKVSIDLALGSILKYMEDKGIEELNAETGIFIVPGYSFKIVDVLITNFHQPGSTLIMLVAAFVGKDWRKIYDYALENDFRFLSYGDSSILEKA